METLPSHPHHDMMLIVFFGKTITATQHSPTKHTSTPLLAHLSRNTCVATHPLPTFIYAAVILPIMSAHPRGPLIPLPPWRSPPDSWYNRIQCQPSSPAILSSHPLSLGPILLSSGPWSALPLPFTWTQWKPHLSIKTCTISTSVILLSELPVLQSLSHPLDLLKKDQYGFYKLAARTILAICFSAKQCHTFQIISFGTPPCSLSYRCCGGPPKSFQGSRLFQYVDLLGKELVWMSLISTKSPVFNEKNVLHHRGYW